MDTSMKFIDYVTLSFSSAFGVLSTAAPARQKRKDSIEPNTGKAYREKKIGKARYNRQLHCQVSILGCTYCYYDDDDVKSVLNSQESIRVIIYHPFVGV